MAQITWRDVATPDFSSASQSFNNFSKLFGEGIAGLKGAVGGFDQAKSDAAQKQFDLALAQMTDAEDIRKAVAGGQVGGLNLNDPNVQRRLDFTAINPTTMTALGSNQVKLGQDRIDATQRGVRDDQSDLIATANHLTRAGKFDEAEKVRAGINFEGFGYKAVDDLNRAVQSMEGAQTGNDQSAFNFEGQKTALDDENAVAKMMSGFRAGAVSPDDAREMLFSDPTGEIAKLSPKARAALESRLSGEYQGLFGSGAGGASAAIAGAAASAGGGSAAIGSGDFGGRATTGASSSIVNAAKELGTTPEELATVISYETGGKFDPDIVGGKDNNHMGLIQFGKEERAKYGITKGMSIEQQMPAVVRYLKDRGFKPGMGILDLYSTINAGTPGRYDASDGNGTVRSHVDKMVKDHGAKATMFLAGGTAAERAQEANALQREMTTRTMQEDPLGYGVDWASLKSGVLNKESGKVATVADVTNNLIGTSEAPGPLYGTDRAYLMKTVTRVMAEAGRNGVAGINPLIAATLIEKNIQGSDAGIWNLADRVKRKAGGGTANLGNSSRLNDRGITEVLGRIRELGGLDVLTNTAEARGMSANSVAQASAASLAAQQKLANIRRLAVTQPALAARLPRYEAEYATALMLEQQAKQMANTPSNQTIREAPPLPPPVRRSAGDSRVMQLLEKYTDGRKSD